MTSQIDATKPVAGNPTTQSVRDQLLIAKNEITALQDGTPRWGAAGGTANAITATFSAPITTLVDGQICCVRALLANTSTSVTFSPDGLTPRAVYRYGGGALEVGSIAGLDHELILRYEAADVRWELLNPASADLGGSSSRTFSAAAATAAAHVVRKDQLITNNIVGTTTNDNATAGNIGEYKESVVLGASAIAGGATTVAINVTSLSLTAGDWNVTGFIGYFATVNLVMTVISGSISATSATNDSDNATSLPLNTTIATSEALRFVVPTRRISLAATTTYYLVTSATYSAGTPTVFGRIQAVRLR